MNAGAVASIVPSDPPIIPSESGPLSWSLVGYDLVLALVILALHCVTSVRFSCTMLDALQPTILLPVQFLKVNPVMNSNHPSSFAVALLRFGNIRPGEQAPTNSILKHERS